MVVGTSNYVLMVWRLDDQMKGLWENPGEKLGWWLAMIALVMCVTLGSCYYSLALRGWTWLEWINYDPSIDKSYRKVNF